MATINMKAQFVTTFSSDEMSMIVRGLIGRLRKEELDTAQKLANQITTQRAEQFANAAQMFRDMLPKEDNNA